jgi:hypothetical protein
MIKVIYLIIGLVFTFGIPLGMLKLAILFADRQEKLNIDDVRVSKSNSSSSRRK